MKNKLMKSPKNFEKLYDELAEWIQNSDSDDSLEYAFANDYQLHAVTIWENSGASQYNFSAGINRKAELKEINQLCDSADIFICPDCNHHGFYEKGELETPPTCYGCGEDNMKLKKD